ncbi:histone family protein DNA-binding protein (plasmid) [Deinococcus proteolyticus MRP]|uniref:Histone family protein DNA-binding protein n=2 Tax=Deinococcus TaxID=1298 RepID=F0RQD2_DEIPM|nr:HU family DNA-binding protein [Deinococcus proteolyticus]ADY27491.1 histone family protein DNA-binding protein [Deinococcus proteolyticus MRP]
MTEDVSSGGKLQAVQVRSHNTHMAKPTKKTTPSPAESGKMGKTALIAELSSKTGLTRQQASGVTDSLLSTVVEALQAGQTVSLPGLGTFSIKETAARTGVKPGTTEKIQIPAGKKVAFKVATGLKGTL